MQILEWTIILFTLSSATSAIKQNEDDRILCAENAGIVKRFDENGEPEDGTPSLNNTCTKKCHTAWQVDPHTGNVTIVSQGCWSASSRNECEQDECVASVRRSQALNKTTKFCCCSRDMCNANFTFIYTEDPVTEPPPKKKSMKTLMCVVTAIMFLIVIITVLISSLIFWKKAADKKSDVETAHQHSVPPPPDYSLEKLKLLNVIGKGRYGCVWRGTIDQQEIAVKVFAAHHRNYFLNERDMYRMSGANSALLQCFGGGEYTLTPGVTDYLLLLSLEQECLQEYLKNQTIDLVTLGKMSLGIAKGLAHLHSDIGKPCIAHRDVNTRNILVRSDLTCCICDLGLAVAPRHAENKSISEAGTLRYMAPEILEGAVNLRDCESALKQIDVYALGLVLWELGTRCVDFQNAEPAAYAAPFHKEVGENPTLEQMQTLVSRHKARPLWPPSWKDTAAARLLCETTEDCWDQDAEARLTSLCVVERLLDLPSLKGRVLHPFHPPASPLINNNHLVDHQLDVSMGTVDTLLSPSEENCKNSNHLVTCVTPLQPYQGRNPCLERNLLSGSSDSLLIDKSLKHCTNSEFDNLITNDFLNYQINYRAAPIPYLQNAVHEDANSKQCNTGCGAQSKSKWNVFRNIFPHKKSGTKAASQVKMNTKVVNGQNEVTTSLLRDPKRPSTLPIIKLDEKLNSSGVKQILQRKNNISRQRSLEQFNEVFSSTNDLSRLKDPSQRVKTPGDVPPSVRRTRGRAAEESARFSLYDDRMMASGQWGSAPNLEPPALLKLPHLNDLQDKDSVSSF